MYIAVEQTQSKRVPSAQAQRKHVVLQAVANLAVKGIVVNPEVMLLYGRYITGELSHAQVRAVMQERAVAIGGQRRYPLCLRAPDNYSGTSGLKI